MQLTTDELQVKPPLSQDDFAVSKFSLLERLGSPLGEQTRSLHGSPWIKVFATLYLNANQRKTNNHQRLTASLLTAHMLTLSSREAAA